MAMALIASSWTLTPKAEGQKGRLQPEFPEPTAPSPDATASPTDEDPGTAIESSHER